MTALLGTLDGSRSPARPGGLRLEPRHRMLLHIADLAAMSVAALLGAVTLTAVDPARAGYIGLPQIVVTVLALAVALHWHGLYRRPASRLRPSQWWRPWAVARCLPTAALLALGLDAFVLGEERMTLTAAVAMTASAVVLIPVLRRLTVAAFGIPVVTRVLIVGTGDVARRLTDRLRRCPDTFVVGHVDDAADTADTLGPMDELPELCRRYNVDRVIISFSRDPDHRTLDVLRRLDGRVPISVIPRFFELHSWRSEIEELQGLLLMHVQPASLGLGARVTKRILDLTLTLAAIVATLPAWLVVAVVIKLDSPGPVFFRQERLGRGERPFLCYKFRTMTADAWDRRAAVAGCNEGDGPLFKMQRDPRVTRVGRLLRRTSIDEVPQLLNVLRGEMSLVGPRPLPTEESLRLDGAALARFSVAPGLTGLWQISGRSDLSYADLQHLDSVYVQSWSLLWDLRIIRDTPASVFRGRGAY